MIIQTQISRRDLLTVKFFGQAINHFFFTRGNRIAPQLIGLQALVIALANRLSRGGLAPFSCQFHSL